MVSKLDTMRKGDRLAGAVKAAINGTPTSVRALARAARLSHGMLVAIRRGTKRPSPETARGIAVALERWSHKLAALARRIRKALGEDGRSETGGTR